MTEPLAQAKAIFKHFRASQVSADIAVIPLNGHTWQLTVPVVPNYVVKVTAAATTHGLRTVVSIPQLPSLMPVDDLARVGGTLIQISNLVRQIRMLAGGNASDSSRSKTAV